MNYLQDRLGLFRSETQIFNVGVSHSKNHDVVALHFFAKIMTSLSWNPLKILHIIVGGMIRESGMVYVLVNHIAIVMAMLICKCIHSLVIDSM